MAIRLTGSGKVTLTVRLGETAGAVDQTPIAQWQTAAEDPEPPLREPDFALRYGKEKSGTVAAASLQLDLASRLGQAGDYDFTFDLYPELETGSFNFYLGGYYQLVYGADGYVLRFRQKDDADFTEQGTYHIGAVCSNPRGSAR